MEADQKPKSGMSKKAFSAGMAITAIVGVDGDVKKLAAIVIVAVAAIVVQGILDWRK